MDFRRPRDEYEFGLAGKLARPLRGSIAAPLAGTRLGGPSYDADAQAHFARAGITDPTYMDLQNALIAGLKSDLGATNLSDAFDCFWIFANQDDGGLAALYNAAKNDHHCTNVNSTPYAAGEGFTGNGTNRRLRTDYFTSTDGAAFTRNSCSLGSYFRLSTGGAAKGGMGARDGTATGNLLYTEQAFQVSGSFSVVAWSVQGLIVANRTGDTTSAIWRNGALVGTSGGSSAALIATEENILCWNENGTPTGFFANQVAVSFYGRGFTDPELVAINTRVETYMDALGKGVQ